MNELRCPGQEELVGLIPERAYEQFVNGWFAGLAHLRSGPAARFMLDDVATMLDQRERLYLERQD